MSLIWVTGASGQVGRLLSHLIRSEYQQWSVRFFSHSEFNLTNVDEMVRWFQLEKPQCIINLAAYTAVDKAEMECDLAYAVNATGISDLATLCAENSVPIIHVSTDYVFSGSASVSYNEDAPVDPQSVYGASKAMGETYLRACHDSHIILRTSWIFSSGNESFVTRILRKGLSQSDLSVVSDQIGCPTAASHLAIVLCRIASQILEERAVYGTYHYRDDTIHSWFSFAQQIMTLATSDSSRWQDVVVSSVPTSAYPTAAIRPSYSVLKVDKLTRDYGIYPMSFATGLKTVVSQIMEQLNHVSA